MKEVEKMKAYATSKKVDYPLSDANLENYLDKKSSDEIKTKDKVNRIIRWWLNWPASLLWWVLSDFIRSLGTTLYHFFGGIFDKMFSMGQNSVKK